MPQGAARALIVAEAGVNHNGSLDLARRLIDVAAESGADVVKFQSFRAEELASAGAPKARYQEVTTSSAESQLDMLRKLQLTVPAHQELIAHARSRGIRFLSTPFDVPSLRLLTRELGLDLIKIPSGEITNGPLLLEVARSGCTIIMSTGMSSLAEVEAALGVLAYGFGNAALEQRPDGEKFSAAYASDAGQRALREKVTLLHCTTEYPAPFADANLLAMDTLATAFRLPVGFSDHTPGIHLPVAAVARAACLIEKHFTLDRSLPGPDHAASLEPAELALMVRNIREVEAALGDGVKRSMDSERKNMPIARKSLVAAAPIRRGEMFTASNLTCKRPGTGISPMRYWSLLGTAASRDFNADDTITGS